MSGDAFDDIVKACRLFHMASQPIRLQVLLALEASDPLTASRLRDVFGDETRTTINTALSKLRSEGLVELVRARKDLYLISPAGRLILEAYRLVSAGPTACRTLEGAAEVGPSNNPADAKAARFFHVVASAARLRLLLQLLDGPLPAADLRARAGGSKNTRQIDFLLKASLVCRVRADDKRGYGLTPIGRRFAEFCSSLESGEATADLFRVFTNPERIRLLALLGEREHCECHIPMALKITQEEWRRLLGDMESVGGLDRSIRGRWAHYALSVTAKSLYRLIASCPDQMQLAEMLGDPDRGFLWSLQPCEDA